MKKQRSYHAGLQFHSQSRKLLKTSPEKGFKYSCLGVSAFRYNRRTINSYHIGSKCGRSEIL